MVHDLDSSWSAPAAHQLIDLFLRLLCAQAALPAASEDRRLLVGLSTAQQEPGLGRLAAAAERLHPARDVVDRLAHRRRHQLPSEARREGPGPAPKALVSPGGARRARGLRQPAEGAGKEAPQGHQHGAAHVEAAGAAHRPMALAPRRERLEDPKMARVLRKGPAV